MTEKDLDIAIEKCERIMEFDTRTLKNQESENGWIFEKVYDLLQFLRKCQFEGDAKGSEVDNMISRQAALDALTDKEQRIFLAAMGREEKVCKEVDEECRDCREPYEDSLVHVCHEIIRKVKGTLWT